MNVLRSLRFHLKEMLGSRLFQSVLLLMTLIAVVGQCTVCASHAGQDMADALPAGQFWFLISNEAIPFYLLYLYVLPLACSFGYVTSHERNRKEGALPVLYTRTKPVVWQAGAMCAVFLSGVLIAGFPVAMTHAASQFAAPAFALRNFTNISAYYDNRALQYMAFPELFVRMPSLYNWLYVGLISLAGGTFACLAYGLCLVMPGKSFYACLIPTALVYLQALLFSALGIEVDLWKIINPAAEVAKNHALMGIGCMCLVCALSFFAVFIRSRKASGLNP